MKKNVIIILAVLPIFLLITIAFAGRIFSYYEHVSVERVVFVNENGVEYRDGDVLVVNVDEQKQINIRIYPLQATNKTVIYSSDDETKFTVDGKGNIRGVDFGTATLIVTTNDGSKRATIQVKVTQDRVTGVSLPNHELEMTVGDIKTITATVEPYVALNKVVEYSSDNPEVVSVDANGRLIAVSEGQATITVTTKDGGFTDTCVVTCKSGTPAMYFDCSDNENFISTENGYKTTLTEILLSDYLKTDAQRINIEEIRFRLKSGNNIATITTDNRLIITGNGILIVTAYVGDPSDPLYQAELRLMIDIFDD